LLRKQKQKKLERQRLKACKYGMLGHIGVGDLAMACVKQQLDPNGGFVNE